jgi:alpha-glucosidase
VIFEEVDAVHFTCPAAAFPLGVEICAPDVLRLSIGMGDPLNRYLPVKEFVPDPLAVMVSKASIETGQLALQGLADRSGLAFCDSKGRTRLALRFADVELHARLRLRFEVIGEQHFYGLGQGGQPFDRLGTSRRLWNCHVNHGPGGDIAIPLVLSSGGYGLFFDQTGPAYMGPGRSYDAICLDYEGDVPSLDLYFLCGADLRETLGSVMRLLGRAPMPPRWALGYLQSTRHFEDCADVLQTVDLMRQKRLPCDAIIFLSSYGEALGWNVGVGHLAYQPALFAEPRALIGALHKRGLRVVTHEYPVLHQHSPLHAEARLKNYLLNEGYADQTGTQSSSTNYHEGQCFLDFSRPEVGAWWWDKHDDLVNDGIDGWWLDGGEGPNVERGADGSALHNRYDLLRQQAFAMGEASKRPNKRPFLLCRSGGPGMQKFGAACWTGDINNTFASLEAQPSLGLNMGLSGVPYWGTDIGGYYPVAPQTPELFVRWFQFGSFCPIFRAHGRNWRKHLPWAYGDEVEAICRRMLELRYRLMPYTYTIAFAAHRDGLPLMRPLVLNYPNDPQVWDISSEFLWGDDLLVAPVTRAGAKNWPVYLPEGRWLDFWNHEIFQGPAAIEVAAPIERLPLFVRAGAILPLASIVQHAECGASKNLTLLVYPDGNSAFTLYDDDGESNAYLNGGYALTTFRCETRATETTLWIDAPRGDTMIVPFDRLYQIRMFARKEPRKIEITGRQDMVPTWQYERPFVTLTISRSPVEIRLHW